MNVKVVTAPELIRPVSDPTRLFQNVAANWGIKIDSSEEMSKPALALIPALQNVEQENAIKYALIGNYAEQVWGDMLPAIHKEFKGIGPVLRGMKRGNVTRSAIEKAITEALQGRDVKRDTLAMALHRIFAAWQLQHQVVEQQRPLSLWPPIFPDPNYEEKPFAFTPVLQCLRQRFWKLGDEKDTFPDSPQVFRGHNWDQVLTEIFNIFHTWYRLDQERLFLQYFKIDPAKRHIYDPIWTDTLVNTGELKFGRYRLLAYPISSVFKVLIDDFIFNINTWQMFPPDIIRAVIEASDEQPFIPAHPVEDYLRMMGWNYGSGYLVEQEYPIYRVAFPQHLPSEVRSYLTDLEVSWFDDKRATVSDKESTREVGLIIRDKIIEVISGAKLLGQVTRPNPGMTHVDTRLLISLWAMWIWQLTVPHVPFGRLP